MSKELLKNQRKVSTADAVEAYRKTGVEINKKQAEEILDLLYFLAKLIVNQNFNK